MRLDTLTRLWSPQETLRLFCLLVDFSKTKQSIPARYNDTSTLCSGQAAVSLTLTSTKLQRRQMLIELEIRKACYLGHITRLTFSTRPTTSIVATRPISLDRETLGDKSGIRLGFHSLIIKSQDLSFSTIQLVKKATSQFLMDAFTQKRISLH